MSEDNSFIGPRDYVYVPEGATTVLIGTETYPLEVWIPMGRLHPLDPRWTWRWRLTVNDGNRHLCYDREVLKGTSWQSGYYGRVLPHADPGDEPPPRYDGYLPPVPPAPVQLTLF